uniref:AIG1-type G domain-containing protein n=1 Tax=Panagrolaimus sp. ES5 TaxID=591445 RepID=A0AC34GLM3_9BILA
MFPSFGFQCSPGDLLSSKTFQKVTSLNVETVSDESLKCLVKSSVVDPLKLLSNLSDMLGCSGQYMAKSILNAEDRFEPLLNFLYSQTKSFPCHGLYFARKKFDYLLQEFSDISKQHCKYFDEESIEVTVFANWNEMVCSQTSVEDALDKMFIYNKEKEIKVMAFEVDNFCNCLPQRLLPLDPVVEKCYRLMRIIKLKGAELARIYDAKKKKGDHSTNRQFTTLIKDLEKELRQSYFLKLENIEQFNFLFADALSFMDRSFQRWSASDTALDFSFFEIMETCLTLLLTKYNNGNCIVQNNILFYTAEDMDEAQKSFGGRAFIALKSHKVEFKKFLEMKCVHLYPLCYIRNWPSIPDPLFLLDDKDVFGYGIVTLKKSSRKKRSEFQIDKFPCFSSDHGNNARFWKCSTCNNNVKSDGKDILCKCGINSIDIAEFRCSLSDGKICNRKPVSSSRQNEKTNKNANFSSKDDKSICNIILFGPVGSGKSTLINAAMNYMEYHSYESASSRSLIAPIAYSFSFFDGNYQEQIIRSKAIPENCPENFESNSHVTQSANVYERFFNGKTYSFVDTVSYSSEIKDSAKFNLEMMKTLKHIDAVWIVISANQKLDDLDSWIYQIIKPIPKKIFSRLYFVFTNIQGKHSLRLNSNVAVIGNYLSKYKEIPFGENNVFAIENNCLKSLYAQGAFCSLAGLQGSLGKTWTESRSVILDLLSKASASKPQDEDEDIYFLNNLYYLFLRLKRFHSSAELHDCYSLLANNFASSNELKGKPPSFEDVYKSLMKLKSKIPDDSPQHKFLVEFLETFEDFVNLEISYTHHLPSKTAAYEMKRKPQLIKPSHFKYSLDLVKPASFIEDISRLLNVPKSYIFQRYNCDKLEHLLKHFLNKPGVLINFHLCDKYKIILPTSNKKEDPMITRIDYGYQFFAVVQALTGETDEIFKSRVEDSLNALFKNGDDMPVRGACVLLFSDNDYNIQPFCNLFDLIKNNCMKKESNYMPISVNLNVELKLDDDRNFDQLSCDISFCDDYAAVFLSLVPPYSSQMVSKIHLYDMKEMQNVMSKSYTYPLMELSMVYEYYQLFRKFVKSYQKNIFEVVTAMKNLLVCAVQVPKKFIYMHGYWFLICDEHLLLNAPPGTRFFISNGNNISTYYDMFQKNGWIFATFNLPDVPEDDYFFVAGETNRGRSYGLAHSDFAERAYPSPSSRLFIQSCPCGNALDSNHWICDACNSFLFYHEKRPDYVSCKCGNIEISSLEFYSYQKKCSIHGFVKYIPFLGNARKLYSHVYNVLIMGPSGAGKSTLVNGIANYLKYETLREAEAHDQVTCVIPCQFEVQDNDYNSHKVSLGKAEEAEENFNSLGHSVTQRPKDYAFSIGNNEYIHIIDTPGLADSRGVDQDNINLELIRQAIINVGQLHALCFVLKPNEAKLTVGLENTMRQLLSIFPKKALESVIFCFTNSRGTFYKPGDSIGPINRLIKDLHEESGAKLNFGKQNVFCMDNEGFRFLCAKACKIDYTTATHNDYEDSWKQSRQATHDLIRRIKDEKPFDTRTINFYTELVVVTKKWAEWLKGCRMSAERCKRFGTVAQELEKNLIGTNVKDLVQLAEKIKFKYPRHISDLRGLMDILHEEFVERDLDNNVANEIRNFIDRYIFQF